MQPQLTKLKRRPFIFPLLLLPLSALVAAAVAAIWFWDLRATTVVIVANHAEAESGDLDPNLSLAGRERAARLARVLSQVQTNGSIDAIFTAETRRTQQTVAPLAESLSLPINVVAGTGWPELSRRIRREHRGDVVVVVGSSRTIPALIETLGGESVTLTDAEADRLYVLFLPRWTGRRLLQLRY
jgi:broad specificity phosphatase PhoE